MHVMGWLKQRGQKHRQEGMGLKITGCLSELVSNMPIPINDRTDVLIL